MYSSFLKLFKNKQKISENLSINDQDINMAQKVHQELLNVDIPNISDLKIASFSKPASKIGGDFYNFIYDNQHAFEQTEGQKGIVSYYSKNNTALTIVIGDVAGHGIASALVMALCCGLIRKNVIQATSLAETVEKTNNDLFKSITNTEISYVTTLMIKIDINLNVLHFTNAGHCPFLIVRENKIMHYNENDLVLGLYENESYRQNEINLKPGDRIILYTDGVTDARNQQNKFLGIDVFEDIILKTQDLAPKEALNHIFDYIHDFEKNTEKHDDQTLIIIDFKS